MGESLINKLIRAKRFAVEVIYSRIMSSCFRKIGNNFYCGTPIYIRRGKYIEVGNHVTIGCRTRIEVWEKTQLLARVRL